MHTYKIHVLFSLLFLPFALHAGRHEIIGKVIRAYSCRSPLSMLAPEKRISYETRLAQLEQDWVGQEDRRRNYTDYSFAYGRYLFLDMPGWHHAVIRAIENNIINIRDEISNIQGELEQDRRAQRLNERLKYAEENYRRK